MIVPYRDPGFDHYRRTAFDIGEWGLGFMTTSLELGCDCLGEIVYLDAVVHDSRGEPEVIKQAICLHEEDNAVLWKHVDSETGAQVRRMRRMVVSVHATVANYEYLIYWRFYQDGNIECEVRATGLMVTTPLQNAGDTSPTGTVVDERTYAPFHQHFLVAKLDLDIDGPDNTVVEVDSVAAPISADNPYGLALNTVSTTIDSEAESARSYSWETQRAWKVFNPSTTNRHGSHPAYKLVPGSAIPSLFDAVRPGPPAGPGDRAHAVGDRPGRRRALAGRGLPDAVRRIPFPEPVEGPSSHGGVAQWIADDAPLVDTDVVLWYVFGIHHITRVEDWPIMPADTVSFWLKPFGFFDQNPSMDAPVSTSRHCHPETTCRRRAVSYGPEQRHPLERGSSMSDKKTFANIIDGEARPSVSGDVLDIVNPSTAEVYATSPNSQAEDVDAACRASAAAFEQWRWTTPSERQQALLKWADVVEQNAEELVAIESENTGKPHGPDHVGGDPADGRPDPLLRRRRAGAGGQVERGVHARVHLLDPPRAPGAGRAGGPVELPDDDGGLEARAGPGRRQHRGPQAVGHHPGVLVVDGGEDAGHLPGRAWSTWSAATGTPGPR